MNEVEVAHEVGDWTFSFRDGVVTEIRVGYRFVLVVGEALIGIEQPFTLHLGGAVSIVPPGDEVWDVGAALPLFNKRVTSAHASRTGHLRIDFDDGTVARVEPEPSGRYERWQVELSGDRVWVGIGTAVGQPQTYRRR